MRVFYFIHIDKKYSSCNIKARNLSTLKKVFLGLICWLFLGPFRTSKTVNKMNTNQ